MSEIKPRRFSAGTIAVAIWLAINAVFMALEVTILNDVADFNNSILLILSIASLVGLFVVRKYGIALTTFTVIYAFSFNAFNLIYFGSSMLNGTSALINAVAATFLFATLMKSAYK